MTVKSTVHEEEAAARRQLRNLEKARKARLRNLEKRRKQAELERRRAEAPKRAAEARKRRDAERYYERIEATGSLTVPTSDQEIAESYATRWRTRGFDVEVAHTDLGWIVREVV